MRFTWNESTIDKIVDDDYYRVNHPIYPGGIMRINPLRALLLLATISLASPPILFASNVISDTHFVAIDLAYVQTGALSENSPAKESLRQPDGIEPVPFILWRNDVTSQSGVWFMTLDPHTGAQRGIRLNVSFPDTWHPVDVVWADHFATSPERGIEPSPFIVFRDYRLQTFPVTYGLDGTPAAGPRVTFQPVIDSVTYGHATCAAELPGTEFADATPRLFIGTDKGYLVMLRFTAFGGDPIAEFLSISALPIVNLQPLPQHGYIALGTLTEDLVRGIRFRPPLPGPYATAFTLMPPRGRPALLDLDSFGPDDVVLPELQSSLRLVLPDGTADLSSVDIAANQTGVIALSPAMEHHDFGIRSAVTGSLLMLSGDGSAVTFDPSYSQQNGSSGCDLNITDGIVNQCCLCGDANGDGAITISDAVGIIIFIFICATG